ncbi:MAG: aminotransferase class I/II-fold pyridoxal phosphate-dependent enzyme, partial [Trueperaceae bacterium]
AMVVIPDDRHREAFRGFARRFHINKGNVFAVAATEAAYRDGAGWLDALLDHLRGNVDLVRERLRAHDLGVSMIEPDGTFLLWLDFRGLGLDPKELETLLARRAGLALAPGYWFGREGAGFARMTIGCPRQTVQDALDRLTEAVASLP